MDNDRVHTLDAGSGGSGLAGLGERLAGLGGSITTRHLRNGHFRLEASLPACGARSCRFRPSASATSVSPQRRPRRDPRAPGRRREPHPHGAGLPAGDPGRPGGRGPGRLRRRGPRDGPPAPPGRGRAGSADARPGRIKVAEQLVTELPACGSLILTSDGPPAPPGRGRADLQDARPGRDPLSPSSWSLSCPPARQPHPHQLRGRPGHLKRSPRRRRPRVPAQDRLGPGPGRRGTYRPPRRFSLRRPRTRRRRHQQLRRDSPLTREADVLELAAGGAPVDEIAKRAWP